MPLTLTPGRFELLVMLLAPKSLVGMWLFVVLMTSAGAVFGSQVSYMKALAGIVWSMLVLNESMSPLAWVSFAIILVGLFLVESRKVDEDQSTENAVGGDKPEVALGAERCANDSFTPDVTSRRSL